MSLQLELDVPVGPGKRPETVAMGDIRIVKLNKPPGGYSALELQFLDEMAREARADMHRMYLEQHRLQLSTQRIAVPVRMPLFELDPRNEIARRVRVANFTDEIWAQLRIKAAGERARRTFEEDIKRAQNMPRVDWSGDNPYGAIVRNGPMTMADIADSLYGDPDKFMFLALPTGRPLEASTKVSPGWPVRVEPPHLRLVFQREFVQKMTEKAKKGQATPHEMVDLIRVAQKSEFAPYLSVIPPDMLAQANLAMGIGIGGYEALKKKVSIGDFQTLNELMDPVLGTIRAAQDPVFRKNFIEFNKGRLIVGRPKGVVLGLWDNIKAIWSLLEFLIGELWIPLQVAKATYDHKTWLEEKRQLATHVTNVITLLVEIAKKLGADPTLGAELGYEAGRVLGDLLADKLREVFDEPDPFMKGAMVGDAEGRVILEVLLSIIAVEKWPAQIANYLAKSRVGRYLLQVLRKERYFDDILKALDQGVDAGKVAKKAGLKEPPKLPTGGGEELTKGPKAFKKGRVHPESAPDEVKLIDMPEETVMMAADPKDYSSARKMYENLADMTPQREAALYRNTETGEFIVVQGEEGLAAVGRGAPTPEFPEGVPQGPAPGGKAQRWKELLNAGSDKGRWELGAHWHPVDPKTGFVAEADRFPSGARGDMGIMFSEARKSGTVRQSRIDFKTPHGPDFTVFGYDPKAKTFWLDYPDASGARNIKKFDTIEDYHKFFNDQFGVDLGDVPPSMRPAGPGPGQGALVPKAGGTYRNLNKKASAEERKIGELLNKELTDFTEVYGAPEIKKPKGAVKGVRSADYRGVRPDKSEVPIDLYQPESGKQKHIMDQMIAKSGQAEIVVLELGKGGNASWEAKEAKEVAELLFGTPGHDIKRLIVVKNDKIILDYTP